MKGLHDIPGTIRYFINTNGKVIENYFYMTILQVLNMCFYLIIYPFLIRVLGAEGYGLYAYAASITLLFITFVNFGFDLPAAKYVAQHCDDSRSLGRLMSTIIACKTLLEIAASVVFVILLYTFPIIRDNKFIFIIVYLQTLTFVIFPTWYYQGLQRMKVATNIQLGLRVLSLPFIFLMIKGHDDVWLFAVITTFTSVFGGLVALAMIMFKDRIHIGIAKLHEIEDAFHEAVPFFLSNVTGVVKEQGIVILIGMYLGMKDVAIYDLANKIIIIPRTIFSKVNDAFYPKLMVQRTRSAIIRILKSETIIGLAAILAIVAFGKIAVSILGGAEMADAYPVCIILSITLLSWLIAGAYLEFCFIPEGYSRYVLYNQIVALLTCFLVSGTGLYIWHNVYALACGIACSGLCEIIFCMCVVKKFRIL